MGATPLVPGPDSISLSIHGQRVRIRYSSNQLRDCVWGNFEAMADRGADGEYDPDLEYSIHVDGQFLRLQCPGRVVARVSNLSDLIHDLEQDLVVELQVRRSDLLFLHSAAVEWHGKAILLAADSGSGKSTTTWALLHHGVGYLSDEMSPIDPRTLDVLAYPHALCLKNAPPAPYSLPGTAMHLGRTIHVPVSALPGPLARQPRPLGAVFLVQHDRQLTEPHLRSLSTAEACARLYVTALNALSHADRGLTTILQIASRVQCFEIRTAELAATCRRILAVLERADACSSSIC